MDHLGNTRTVIDESCEIVQSSEYYPFGMRFGQTSSGSSNNDYLYNGKEMQEDVDWYDYGARMYDPALGRFHTQDPMIEEHFSWTSYAYTYNNPILYTDPFGLDTFNINVNDGTIDRINVEDSESHTYILSSNGEVVTTYNLAINDFGLVEFTGA